MFIFFHVGLVRLSIEGLFFPAKTLILSPKYYGEGISNLIVRPTDKLFWNIRGENRTQHAWWLGLLHEPGHNSVIPLLGPFSNLRFCLWITSFVSSNHPRMKKLTLFVLKCYLKL